jgi:hypothetical protein
MADWVEVYSNAVENAEIAASAKEIFCSETTDKDAKTKYGSFNFLVLSSSSANTITLKLDGLQQFARIQGAGFAIIEAKDGRFFNYFEVLNESGSTAVTAGDINIRYGISIPREELQTKSPSTSIKEARRQQALRYGKT